MAGLVDEVLEVGLRDKTDSLAVGEIEDNDLIAGFDVHLLTDVDGNDDLTFGANGGSAG